MQTHIIEAKGMKILELLSIFWITLRGWQTFEQVTIEVSHHHLLSTAPIMYIKQ